MSNDPVLRFFFCCCSSFVCLFVKDYFPIKEEQVMILVTCRQTDQNVYSFTLSLTAQYKFKAFWGFPYLFHYIFSFVFFSSSSSSSSFLFFELRFFSFDLLSFDFFECIVNMVKSVYSDLVLCTILGIKSLNAFREEVIKKREHHQKSIKRQYIRNNWTIITHIQKWREKEWKRKS